ncbi:MAG: hypothetical protein IIB00_01305 [candidate division Zixibacteria bacterium]|nr:hypothetical protein [candidate division Zixibacteria bacterium]
MSLPYGRAINPISGTNWEGVGVEPDISVPANDALDVAHMEALKGLLENETDKRKLFTLEWGIAGINARINPVDLSVEEKTRFEGIYGPRKVWFENSVYHYQRGDGPTFDLTYMGDNRFMIEDLDYFRIQFSDIKNGKANKLNGQYAQGRVDNNARTDSYVKK